MDQDQAIRIYQALTMIVEQVEVAPFQLASDDLEDREAALKNLDNASRVAAECAQEVRPLVDVAKRTPEAPSP